MNKAVKVSLTVAALIATTALAYAATQQDILVSNSSMGGGSANGFIGKGTYNKGARVYVHAGYSQECLNGEEPATATETVLGAFTSGPTYDTRNAKGIKQTVNGYYWSLGFSATPTSGDICNEQGYTANGEVTQTGGTAFLSNDGGSTVMLDTLTSNPIEVNLAP